MMNGCSPNSEMSPCERLHQHGLQASPQQVQPPLMSQVTVIPLIAITRLSFPATYLSGNHGNGTTQHCLTAYTANLTKLRERTIPTERQPLVGEVIADYLRIEGATWSA
jgi:hypothetical protein